MTWNFQPTEENTYQLKSLFTKKTFQYLDNAQDQASLEEQPLTAGAHLRQWTMLILFIFTGQSYGQALDTATVQLNPIKIQSFIVPAAFIGYGMISLAGKNPIRSLDLTTKDELQEDHPLFAAHIDNYMQFAPAAAVFGLHLAGIRGKHNFGDATALYMISMTVLTGSVTSLKHITARERPDHSVFNSFPSGHTATVFASAEFLKQEYGDQYPWLGYTGYVVAVATGTLRMYNNRHWFSDVVAGAGFGMVFSKLSYLLYPKIKQALGSKHQHAWNMMRFYQHGNAGIYLSSAF